MYIYIYIYDMCIYVYIYICICMYLYQRGIKEVSPNHHGWSSLSWMIWGYLHFKKHHGGMVGYKNYTSII